MILPVLKWENKIQRKPKKAGGPEGTSPAGRVELRVEELGSKRVAWLRVPFRALVGSDAFGQQAQVFFAKFRIVLT